MKKTFNPPHKKTLAMQGFLQFIETACVNFQVVSNAV